jgi:phosphohistidine phosphatase SixA
MEAIKVEMRNLFLRIFLPAIFLSQFLAAQENARTVFLVRHAEKASTAADALLSPAGQQRAECLANTLKDAGIKQIFVSEVKRTQQTAEPLAKLLKITPTSVPARDTATLLRDITYSGTGNVLVVGHSDTLPVVIARLKAGSIKPIGDDEYDRLFVINLLEGSATPVATLHYCSSGVAGTPAPSHKTGTRKPPAMKR